MLRRTKSVLATGTEEVFNSDSHPPLEERLLIVDMLPYDLCKAEAVQKMRENFRELMEGV